MKKILFMMAVCLMSMQITPNKCLASSNQNDSIIGVDILLLQYIDKGSMGKSIILKNVYFSQKMTLAILMPMYLTGYYRDCRKLSKISLTI